ncbi:MAG: hypothetical protein ACRD20_20410 [Terriglobales bacterium]
MKKLIFILLALTCAHAQIFVGDKQTGGGGGSGSALTINALGNGTGTVATLDGFINCIDTAGVISGTCAHTYSGAPSIQLIATPGSNTTVAFSNGAGSAIACSGSSSTLLSCTFSIVNPSSLSVTFTTPANSAIPGTYTGIGLNSFNNVGGCTTTYPSAIHHGRDRWWDTGNVQWAYINTATDVYDWTFVDALACAAFQNGADIHWTMNRTPWFATGEGSVQYTDAGDCNYYKAGASITNVGTANPDQILSISKSGMTVTVTYRADANFNPGAGAIIVVQDISGTGGDNDYDGIYTVLTSTSTQLTYTAFSTLAGTPVLTGATISVPANLRLNSPAQCDPPTDVNPDGSGSNQIWRDWIGAAAAHTNAPSWRANHAHIAVWEDIDEPDTCQFFSCAFGSYDIQARWSQDRYCILKGGAYYVNGGVTSGRFVTGESVTQASTGSTATLVGAPNFSSDLLNFTAAPSGSPDSSHTWTGGTSGAVYTPTIAPTQMTVRATGETCLQVRTAVTHGAGSAVVNTTIFSSFPTLPLDTTAIMSMGSYHPPDASAKQAQAYLYCAVPGGTASKAVCGGTGHTNQCQASGSNYTSCHTPGAFLTTEVIDEHYKPGPANTSPPFEQAMVTAIGQVEAILTANEAAKPIFLPEAAYASCGWPTVTTACDQSSPWGVIQMQAAFMGDYFTYTWSLGNIPENVLYNWNPAHGGLGAACSGSGPNGNYCANTAMTTVFNWITGATISGCAISNGVATNSLYKCSVESPFPGPGLTSGTIVWDNAELCTGTNGQLGSCPTHTQTITSTHCYDIGGNAPVTITGNNVAVGIMPQLCE